MFLWQEFYELISLSQTTLESQKHKNDIIPSIPFEEMAVDSLGHVRLVLSGARSVPAWNTFLSSSWQIALRIRIRNIEEKEELGKTRVRESADLIWNPCSTEKSFFLYQVTVGKNKGRKCGGGAG